MKQQKIYIVLSKRVVEDNLKIDFFYFPNNAFNHLHQ